jgi:hypothetical protein
LQALVDGVFWVSLLAVALGPLLVLRLRYGARLRWAFLGIGSWVVGCTAKVVIHYGCGLDHPVDGLGLQLARSTLSGVVSATTELAAAALFLLKARLRLVDVFAFGVGIGAFEVVFLLGCGVASAAEPTPEPVPLLIQLCFPIERTVALLLHTASRLLVYIALRRHSLLAGAIALAAFSLIDGTADHGTTAGWDFASVRVQGPFLAFCAVVTALEGLAAWRLWRAMGCGSRPLDTSEESR